MNAWKPQIREARAADAAVIVEFNCRLAWETEGKRLDKRLLAAGVGAALARPELARYFVAERVDAPDDLPSIVGQMMITYEWSDWRNGLFWWIQSVYVREDARRQGVFRTLYDHVEAAARATHGTCGLRLYVERENRNARTTYERLGMKPSGHVLYERDWSGAVL